MNVPGFHLVRADSGFENIVYLIVLMIWGIAQVIRKGSRIAPSAPPPDQSTQPVPQTEMPDELRQMLENLTGQKMEPARPPPPPPPPVGTRNRRAFVPRSRATTLPPPAPRLQPQAAAPQPAPVYALPELSRQLPHAVASALTLKGLTGSLKSVRMPTASMGGGMPMAPRPGHIGAPILDLRDRALLRNAILGRIILGPPKALEASPKPET